MMTIQRLVRKHIRVLLVTVVFAAVLVGTWFLMGPIEKNLKFMHCERCKNEWPYDHVKVLQKCPRCAPKHVEKMVATMKPLKENPGTPMSRFLLFGAFEAVLFLISLYFAIRPPGGKIMENVLYCNCPHCKWRLRFKESSVGKGGVCPRCKRMFRFPELQEADKGPIRDPLAENVRS